MELHRHLPLLLQHGSSRAKATNLNWAAARPRRTRLHTAQTLAQADADQGLDPSNRRSGRDCWSAAPSERVASPPSVWHAFNRSRARALAQVEAAGETVGAPSHPPAGARHSFLNRPGDEKASPKRCKSERDDPPAHIRGHRRARYSPISRRLMSGGSMRPFMRGRHRCPAGRRDGDHGNRLVVVSARFTHLARATARSRRKRLPGKSHKV